MKFLIALICIALTSINLIAQTPWKILDIGEGTKPCISIGNNGELYVSSTVDSKLGWVRVYLVNSDHVFVDTIISVSDVTGPAEITIDENGNPTMVLHNHTNGGDLYWLNKQNNFWRKDVLKLPNHDGWDASIIKTNSGKLFAISLDAKNLQGFDGLNFHEQNDTGWVKGKVGTEPLHYFWGTSLVQGANEVIHASYYNQDLGISRYAYRENDSWKIETIDSVAQSGYFSSLSIHKDSIYCVYLRKTKESFSELIISKRTEVGWQSNVLDTIYNLNYNIARHLISSSWHYDTLLISYANASNVYLGKFSIDKSYKKETIASDNNQNMGQSTDLVIGSKGEVYVAFWKYNLLKGRVYVATPEGTLSLAENVNFNEWVYPNPSNGDLYFSDDENSTIEIYNVFGKVVLREFNVHSKITFKLAQGLYFVNRSSEKGVLFSKFQIK